MKDHLRSLLVVVIGLALALLNSNGYQSPLFAYRAIIVKERVSKNPPLRFGYRVILAPSQ